MTTRLSIGLTMLFCSTVCPAVWAVDYHTFDVKPGQWENSSTSQATGALPIPDEVLKSLSPEQRAKVEAMAKAQLARGAQPTVTKHCVTKDDLNKPFDTGDEKTRACTHNIIASSGSKQEIQLDCNRQGMKTTGTVKVEAVDSEHIKGSIQMAMTGGDHTMNMNYTFTSRWIGPACTEK